MLKQTHICAGALVNTKAQITRKIEKTAGRLPKNSRHSFVDLQSQKKLIAASNSCSQITFN